jgi:hypothetical protein
MQSPLGKRLRSGKVKLACEQRNQQSAKKIYANTAADEVALLATTNQKALNSNERNNENRKNNGGHYTQYDTVSSVHDIEQDVNFDYPEPRRPQQLQNIVEVPSKNITRNNSVADATEMANLSKA